MWITLSLGAQSWVSDQQVVWNRWQQLILSIVKYIRITTKRWYNVHAPWTKVAKQLNDHRTTTSIGVVYLFFLLTFLSISTNKRNEMEKKAATANNNSRQRQWRQHNAKQWKIYDRSISTWIWTCCLHVLDWIGRSSVDSSNPFFVIKIKQTNWLLYIIVVYWNRLLCSHRNYYYLFFFCGYFSCAKQ